jgi:hypothetical protein
MEIFRSQRSTSTIFRGGLPAIEKVSDSFAGYRRTLPPSCNRYWTDTSCGMPLRLWVGRRYTVLGHAMAGEGDRFYRLKGSSLGRNLRRCSVSIQASES